MFKLALCVRAGGFLSLGGAVFILAQRMPAPDSAHTEKWVASRL
jgi:hypothetical protein